MHDIYRVKDCMKKFCESLRKHGMKIINFKKESYKNAKICYICNEKFEDKYGQKKKKNDKVRNHCHYAGLYKGPGHSMFNSKYGIPKEIQ